MIPILVVDDHKIVQRVLGHTLRKAGYQVTLASRGAEALALLGEQQFELAILDIAMPEMDGIELLRTIRTLAQHAHMPVIMLTASSNDDDRIRAQEAGANHFLTKPTGSAQLLAVVEQLLSESSLA